LLAFFYVFPPLFNGNLLKKNGFGPEQKHMVLEVYSNILGMKSLNYRERFRDATTESGLPKNSLT
jgi:hypothetical protein